MHENDNNKEKVDEIELSSQSRACEISQPIELVDAEKHLAVVLNRIELNIADCGLFESSVCVKDVIFLRVTIKGLIWREKRKQKVRKLMDERIYEGFFEG